MFLKSKFLNLGNDFQVTPKYECWCGHFTYMVNVPYQWSEQKARQSRLTKPSLGIMKNGYWSNYEEWRRKIGDLETLESKVIINFRVFFWKQTSEFIMESFLQFYYLYTNLHEDWGTINY